MVPALLLFDKPMGFVAILGILALIGIIIRNAVILVSQIEEFRSEGMAPWDAVFEATQHRMRPILLTAAAASLGMVPIAREVFWGPMAYAMIGGIIAATFLTLFFLPALYVGWYRIRPRMLWGDCERRTVWRRLSKRCLAWKTYMQPSCAMRAGASRGSRSRTST